MSMISKLDTQRTNVHCIGVMVIRTVLVYLVLLCSAFAAEGSFVGRIVKGPDIDVAKKWIYVQGPHRSMRRVDISSAKISFDPSVAKKDRKAKPEDALRQGEQVRVAASLDGQGEWKASAVEILSSK